MQGSISQSHAPRSLRGAAGEVLIIIPKQDAGTSHARPWWRRTAPRRELTGLLGFFGVAAAMLAFVKLAEEMLEGDTDAFDHAVLLAIRDPTDPRRSLGPAWLESVARDITALGSTIVLSLITFVVAGYLALSGQRMSAVLVLASVVTGAAISSLLKAGFARPRPDLVAHGVDVFTASFPSGHAMLSAVVYLPLGALLMRFDPHPGSKPYTNGHEE